MKPLSSIDNGKDLDVNYLTAIYERIHTDEFCPDADHLTQVAKFEQTLIGKQSILTAPHCRLECCFPLLFYEFESSRIQSELDKLPSSSDSRVDRTNHNGIVPSLIDYATNKRDRLLPRILPNSLVDTTLTANNHSSLPS
ncbi:unnamed protein product [Rotaria magnacalcarata]|uniref:Uncharacterized protein n=1 Tax=Rotaria magnacalcarata TaxID=392030 RepID=A0A815Y590_9BILA|nr:unnamed protein product [Rotaria magnacalcarata]CAF1565800.1 unnamed protein product [Rotaria magnacalcarata]